MPFVVTYNDDEGVVRTLRNVTKLEGVWEHGGNLSHYCLYVGNRPTEHRRLGMVAINRVLGVSAVLPEVRSNG